MKTQLDNNMFMHVIHGIYSMSEVVADIKSRGYELKFRREATGLHCVELGHLLTPENFSVDEYYHFEDASNTDRERTLYAVSSTQGLKGFLVDACFVYEDNISREMAKKLNGKRDRDHIE